MENEKFVTVLTFTFVHEVAVIRGRLEAEGIICFVKDEFTVQVQPFYSNAIGGVKLQVRENDLNQAIEILKETGYIKEEELQASQELSRLNKHADNQRILMIEGKIICPFCGSEEVVKSKKAGWLFLLTSFVSLLLFMVPTPILQKTYYCFDCKQEFKQKRK
jgi:DNA-directed RNA polymerase subunit RPC12/RpoP